MRVEVEEPVVDAGGVRIELVAGVKVLWRFVTVVDGDAFGSAPSGLAGVDDGADEELARRWKRRFILLLVLRRRVARRRPRA